MYGKHPSKKKLEMMSRIFSGSGNPFYGKHHSDEAKIKMSIARKNRPPISEETRQKMSETRRGEHHPRFHWSHEKLKEESSKYKSRGAFKAESPNAYAAAWRNHWLDDFFPKQ